MVSWEVDGSEDDEYARTTSFLCARDMPTIKYGIFTAWAENASRRATQTGPLLHQKATMTSHNVRKPCPSRHCSQYAV